MPQPLKTLDEAREHVVRAGNELERSMYCSDLTVEEKHTIQRAKQELSKLASAWKHQRDRWRRQAE